MSRNRIKSANSLRPRWLGWVIVVTIVAAGLGGLYVYWQNKIDVLAKDNKKLEAELADWQKKNGRLALQRQSLTTPNSLVRRLDYFHIEMVALNKLPVLDAQSFRATEPSMLARGPRPGGESYP
ncbi:MAG: hypothetical protein LBK71_10575 [Verrucomicrobiales bacterium]|jgi:hypothetical protein|nr:hypothetical protein [Verrucomicrobiales bacterium]MDR1305091.1 hypothetical protein [Verrucomicrobiales bacterium]